MGDVSLPSNRGLNTPFGPLGLMDASHIPMRESYGWVTKHLISGRAWTVFLTSKIRTKSGVKSHRREAIFNYSPSMSTVYGMWHSTKITKLHGAWTVQPLGSPKVPIGT